MTGVDGRATLFVRMTWMTLSSPLASSGRHQRRSANLIRDSSTGLYVQDCTVCIVLYVLCSPVLDWTVLTSRRDDKVNPLGYIT
jgi:hypothetical protein